MFYVIKTNLQSDSCPWKHFFFFFKKKKNKTNH